MSRVYIYILEKEMATHSSIPAWRIPGTGEPGGLPSMGSHRVRHDWSDLACIHALEKKMATHSSVPAWRIPGMEEPGGLLSMGLHRVGHDWLKRLSGYFESFKYIIQFSSHIINSAVNSTVTFSMDILSNILLLFSYFWDLSLFIF